MKEHVTLEVRESVSPYGEMMKLLKEYIDQHDTITYCDALPDEGEEDHLYIVTSGEAYIWEDEWIELTGGGTTGITGINLNGTPQEVINHVVDLLIKTSDLENDSGYITDSALDGYAKTEDIPTELSDLKNDMGYITDSALEDYATADEVYQVRTYAENVDATAQTALNTANEVKDAAITGITLNGDEVPVTDNIAALTIEAEAPIEHIAVNGEEQPIEDKTVDLAIDRASVDGETLVVGDTAGGGNSQIVSGTLDRNESVTFTGTEVVIHATCSNKPATAICANSTYECVGDEPNWLNIGPDGNSYTMTSDTNATIYYIAIIMEG